MEYYICNHYQKTIIRKNDDGTISSIPFETLNQDYQQYLAWLSEGNEPEEWNPDTINGGEE